MTVSVAIQKNVYGGDGLGRLGDGRVVFVSGAFAGERVRAEIVGEKSKYVVARLVEIESPSPERTGTGALPLPGMVYANLSRKAELAAKGAQLDEALARARLTNLKGERIDYSPAEESSLHYRNKAVYHFARQNGKWVLGYRLEPSHEILDLENDALARDKINDALGEIRRSVFRLLTQGAPSVRDNVARQGNVTVRWSARSGVRWWLGDKAPGDVTLQETTLGRVFEVPADGFYQVHPEAGEALVKSVVDEYLARASEAAHIVDLYCGVGVFGISALAEAKKRNLALPVTPRLVGVESGRRAIDFARANAAAAGVEGRFHASLVAGAIRRLPIGNRTTVILDPPRGGVERGVAERLAASHARRILYVSCDPATLVRDLRPLVKDYEISSVRWLDMFPRTARFETFVTMEKRKLKS